MAENKKAHGLSTRALPSFSVSPQGDKTGLGQAPPLSLQSSDGHRPGDPCVRAGGDPRERGPHPSIHLRAAVNHAVGVTSLVRLDAGAQVKRHAVGRCYPAVGRHLSKAVALDPEAVQA